MDSTSPITMRLAQAMKTKGFTQETLAKSLGVSDSKISKWMNGAYHIPMEFYERICSALKVSIGWLVNGVGAMQSINVQSDIEKSVVSNLRRQKLHMQAIILYLMDNWEKSPPCNPMREINCEKNS